MSDRTEVSKVVIEGITVKEQDGLFILAGLDEEVEAILRQVVDRSALVTIEPLIGE